MKRLIYIDGYYVDNVSMTDQEIEFTWCAIIKKKEVFTCPLVGLSERVYLETVQYEDFTDIDGVA